MRERVTNRNDGLVYAELLFELSETVIFFDQVPQRLEGG